MDYSIDIFINPNVQDAPVSFLANAIAVDYLRHLNIDARPDFMQAVKAWKPEVHDEVVRVYPHHAV
ncbi:MAG: hypothetical protein GY757_18990 [bacterium]|nr:hypothetical protein [bacterium]